MSVVCPVSCDALEPSGLVSPSSTVRSLTKELQHSLDLASATSGDKVVTAQVSEAVDLTFVLVLMYRVAAWFFIARLLNLFLFFLGK